MAVKAAVSAKAPAGLKSSAVVWYIQMYLSMCGIDPEEYTGFAFGVGLERIALLKYEIDDMRLLYENDIRFIKTVLDSYFIGNGGLGTNEYFIILD